MHGETLNPVGKSQGSFSYADEAPCRARNGPAARVTVVNPPYLRAAMVLQYEVTSAAALKDGHLMTT